MELAELAESVVAAAKSYVARAMKDIGARMDSFQVLLSAREEMERERSEQTVKSLEAINSQIAAMESNLAFLKALPVAPASFVVDGDGNLVSVFADGATKEVGKVRGEDGKRGASVMDCSIDGEGQLSLRMSDGRMLNAGTVRGARGEPGKDGQAQRGRDAAELKIATGIDEAKSYPEGTCAAYRGGVIRAERSTQPLEAVPDLAKAGWTVILEGIAEESEESIDGGRFVERTTVYTSGKTFKRRGASAMMIYRGIWSEQQYAKGDTATWNGSLWHCERPTKSKPGAGEDWKLVAKAGRDANATKH
jgi:hypothetical protein